MIQLEESCDVEACRALVARIVASELISRSTRLRDMFLYLSAKVLDEQVSNVHELELGHRVFGRPEHYDTATDNIVRVHASLLRKRLAEYFRTEGREEDLVIEIPRGNYAPVFRPRPAEPSGTVQFAPEAVELPSHQPTHTLEPVSPSDESASSQHTSTPHRLGSVFWVGLGLALVVVLSALTLHFFARSGHRPSGGSVSTSQIPPLWNDLFSRDTPTQLVLDDASLDLYQQATGHPVPLDEYYDRSYLTVAEKSAARAHLDPGFVHASLLRRQSSFATANLAGKLAALGQELGSAANVQFARDFSFHQLKSGNIILLGSAGANPWIQPFENSVTVHWRYTPELASWYPVDSTAGPAAAEQFYPGPESTRQHESYATVDFLPNLGGTGHVLILSGTGGAAIGAALAFITDPSMMSQIASKLPKTHGATPSFEVLLRVQKDAGPRNTQILIVRSPKAT